MKLWGDGRVVRSGIKCSAVELRRLVPAAGVEPATSPLCVVTESLRPIPAPYRLVRHRLSTVDGMDRGPARSRTETCPLALQASRSTGNAHGTWKLRAPGWDRTSDLPGRSRMLCPLSYERMVRQEGFEPPRPKHLGYSQAQPSSVGAAVRVPDGIRTRNRRSHIPVLGPVELLAQCPGRDSNPRSSACRAAALAAELPGPEAPGDAGSLPGTGSGGRVRTCSLPVNSRLLCPLSYSRTRRACGTRTRSAAVKAQRPNP